MKRKVSSIVLVFQNIETKNVVSIKATTSRNMSILTLNITDDNVDTRLNVGILSGNINNAFKFSLASDNSNDEKSTHYEATADLIVVGQLDYKSIPQYSLKLFAFDSSNMVEIDVQITILPENTNAPYFKLMPGFDSYEYNVTELKPYSLLSGAPVKCDIFTPYVICASFI